MRCGLQCLGRPRVPVAVDNQSDWITVLATNYTLHEHSKSPILFFKKIIQKLLQLKTLFHVFTQE